MPAEEKKNLGAACAYFGIHPDTAHRALSDAMAAHLLYTEMKKRFGEEKNELFEARSLQYKAKKEKLATNEKENIRINTENAALRSQNDEYRQQTESTIKRLQRELSTLQDQFDSTVKENNGFSEKYSNLMKNIRTNTEKADQLFIENTDLRRENAVLIQRVNTELLPMKDENQRLKELVEKLRKTEMAVTEENIRIFTENAI